MYFLVNVENSGYTVVSPAESNRDHASKMSNHGEQCDDSLFLDGKYKFFSPYMGIISHASDLRRLFGRKGSFLPNLISWYGEGPEDDKIYLISFAGK